MADIENLSTADLQAWYDTYYAPNNATLVVVGDVDYNEVINTAKNILVTKSHQHPRARHAHAAHPSRLSPCNH